MEVRWRSPRPAGSVGSRFTSRCLVAKGRDAVRAAVALRCRGAHNGELRITVADGRVIWTDVVEVAGWRRGPFPRERRDGLWLAEVGFARDAGATLADIERAVGLGRRRGVLRPNDAFRILEFAEALIDGSRRLPGARGRGVPPLR